MRLRIRCELSMWRSSCLTSSLIKVVTDWWTFISPHLQRRRAFTNHGHHLCFIQIVEKIPERASPKLV